MELFYEVEARRKIIKERSEEISGKKFNKDLEKGRL